MTDQTAARAAAPVKQRADCTETEWAEQERARFERLYTRETVRADTAARDADIYQGRLERLGEGYTRERKRAEKAEADANHNADLVAAAVQRAEQAEAEAERLRTDRAAACICGHAEAQHFEDACLVCDCGDYLVAEAAREVIARWRAAATRAPADRAVVPAVAPATDQAALRDRIAEALLDHLSRTADIRPGRNGQLAFMPEIDDPERLRIADAVLSVLPAPAGRAAVLREAADRYADLVDQNEAYERAEHGEIDHESRLQYEAVRDVVAGLRRMADECPQCGDAGACNGGPCPLRRLAVEAQQPETQPEDPARIDRLRPEFFEHASVESIDAQIQRARRQRGLWDSRVQKLAGLRKTRIAQKERGEWPAVEARQPKEARS